MELSTDIIAAADAPEVNGEQDAWLKALALCGDRVRKGVASPKEKDSAEKQVIARSYTVKQAAKLARRDSRNDAEGGGRVGAG